MFWPYGIHASFLTNSLFFQNRQAELDPVDQPHHKGLDFAKETLDSAKERIIRFLRFSRRLKGYAADRRRLFCATSGGRAYGRPCICDHIFFAFLAEIDTGQSGFNVCGFIHFRDLFVQQRVALGIMDLLPFSCEDCFRITEYNIFRVFRQQKMYYTAALSGIGINIRCCGNGMGVVYCLTVNQKQSKVIVK